MKLSEMTVQQLEDRIERAKREIDKRRAGKCRKLSVEELQSLVASRNDDLVAVHRQSGGCTFRGTFLDLLRRLDLLDDGSSESIYHSTITERCEGRGGDYIACTATSVFGEEVRLVEDLSDEDRVDGPLGVREWIVRSLIDPADFPCSACGGANLSGRVFDEHEECPACGAVMLADHDGWSVIRTRTGDDFSGPLFELPGFKALRSLARRLDTTATACRSETEE